MSFAALLTLASNLNVVTLRRDFPSPAGSSQKKHFSTICGITLGFDLLNRVLVSVTSSVHSSDSWSDLRFSARATLSLSNFFLHFL